MKKLLFICTLFTIVMMTACRNWTANRNNDKLTLIGHWETVFGHEEWVCNENEESDEWIRKGNPVDTVKHDLDSADYLYISFDIDKDSISMVMHDKCCDPMPPLSITKLTVGYSVDSLGVVTWFFPDVRGSCPKWKILELTADKFVFKEEYGYEDCMGTLTYTMKKR